MSEAGRRGFPRRFAGAFRLDASVFEEVEHDPRALPQAAAVVAIGGLARAAQMLPEQGAMAALSSLLAAFVIWFAVTAAVTAVGVHILHGSSSFDQMLRTLGFAAAPLVALTICVLPLGAFGTALSALVHAFALGALVLAVRQALDIDTPRALVVCAGAVGLGIGLLLLLGIFVIGWPAS